MKKHFLFLAFSFLSITMWAQWIPQTSNIPPGYYAAFIDAVDPNVCWSVLGDGSSNVTPVQDFIRTIDGGTTWIPGVINNATGLRSSSICALNADTAWVTMWDPNGIRGKILRTNDGGASWTHQSTALFTAAGNFPNIVFFWDADNGVCMGDPTNGYFEIYTTANGGTNWTRVPSGSIPPNLINEIGLVDLFSSYKNTSLWFGTSMGRVYKTSNRGLSWTVAQTPFADGIGDLTFSDSLHGLATSGGPTLSTDVARTSDGGTTWALAGTNVAGMAQKLSMCYVPGTDSTFFISTAVFPALGTVMGTAFSMNGGADWIPVDNLVHMYVDFVNDSTGWTGSYEPGAPMFKWTTPISEYCAVNMPPIYCCGPGGLIYTCRSCRPPDYYVSFQWYFNDSIIPGATDTFIVPDRTGIYTVEATNQNGCKAKNVPGMVIVSCSGLTVTLNITDASNDTTADGSITATITGGTAPYTFLWSNSETAPTISGLGKGNYCVTVMDDLSCLVTECDSVHAPHVSVGIFETGNLNIGFYPNPAHDELLITSNGQPADAVISIYTLLGEKVLEEKANLGSGTSISIIDLPSGIYFVKVSDGQKQYTQKLIIQ